MIDQELRGIARYQDLRQALGLLLPRFSTMPPRTHFPPHRQHQRSSTLIARRSLPSRPTATPPRTPPSSTKSPCSPRGIDSRRKRLLVVREASCRLEDDRVDEGEELPGLREGE